MCNFSPKIAKPVNSARVKWRHESRQVRSERWSRDVDGVVDEHVLIVLGQRNDVALGGHAQTTAATHLHVRTLELRSHGAVALQHNDVEPIAVAVADQNVARVARVDPVRIRCQRLVAEPTHEFPILRKHGDAVTLKNTPEMTDDTTM